MHNTLDILDYAAALTGHRSLKVLHQYERTSERQLLDVQNVMSSSGASNPKNDSGCKGSKDKNEDILTFVVSGCTFSGCSISFAGSNSKTINQSKPDDLGNDLLKGIDASQILMTLTNRPAKTDCH